MPIAVLIDTKERSEVFGSDMPGRFTSGLKPLGKRVHHFVVQWVHGLSSVTYSRRL
jgi:hypothetical protein